MDEQPPTGFAPTRTSSFGPPLSLSPWQPPAPSQIPHGSHSPYPLFCCDLLPWVAAPELLVLSLRWCASSMVNVPSSARSTVRMATETEAKSQSSSRQSTARAMAGCRRGIWPLPDGSKAEC